MQDKTIADTMNLTIDFNDIDDGQFADVIEKIRAERRALLKATQEKYAKSRAQKALIEQQKQRLRVQLQCLYGAVVLIMLSLGWVFSNSEGTIPSLDEPGTTHRTIEMTRDHRLDDTQLSQVERYFTAKFLVGDWRFRGANAEGNGITIHIEMPQPLSLEPHYQREYIRNSLCPKGDSELWLSVEPADLTIHLYSDHPSRGQSALCAS
ncbi:hypothetical protein NI389_19445 (plasmid) [Pseudoalteromonas xiamenensis]|uniref:hypothetical protein n=1 Tax=Pseudoalteromonas xiamenensis TaxID=882626 RepID=UPI0027E4676B|nr:hypothetical protein [Pseudoalteromonas xiamenensis]WMN61977.1 hypothetical protein NI389_19445 [Pseudoalteromonas xiamenensis]